jgi:hypothetical protein
VAAEFAGGNHSLIWRNHAHGPFTLLGGEVAGAGAAELIVGWFELLHRLGLVSW